MAPQGVVGNVRLEWSSASLDAELGQDQRAAMVTVSVTGAELTDGSASRYFVKTDGTRGEAVFSANTSEPFVGPPHVVFGLLITTQDDDGMACETQMAFGVLDISDAHLYAGGDVDVVLSDTAALSPYAVRCLDTHRDGATDRAMIRLSNLKVHADDSFARASKAGASQYGTRVLSQANAEALRMFHSDVLMQERHALFSAMHFECVERGLASFQTLGHPARLLDTRDGEQSLAIEDSLLFANRAGPDAQMGEDVLMSMLATACAQEATTPEAFGQQVADDPCFERVDHTAEGSPLRVAGGALRMVRPPYETDHKLDTQREHAWRSKAPFRSALDDHAAVSETVAERVKNVTDRITYIDLANGSDAGDCDDGCPMVMDVLHAFAVYDGTSMALRAMRHIVRQYEPVVLNMRCVNDECHVVTTLLPIVTFCRALADGCDAVSTRTIGTRRTMYESITRQSRAMQQSLEAPMTADDRVRASDFIERCVHGGEPVPISGKHAKNIPVLFIETTGLVDPVTSIMSDGARARAKKSAAVYASMVNAAPKLRAWVIREAVNASAGWPAGSDYTQTLRTRPGSTADDFDGKSYFSFYRDITAGSLCGPLTTELAALAGNVRPIRGLFGQKAGGSIADDAPLKFGITVESLWRDTFCIYPTSYVDRRADAVQLSRTNELLRMERSAFRNLRTTRALPCEAPVLFGNTQRSNLFYRPDVPSCELLFDRWFDPSITVRTGSTDRATRTALEVDVRALEEEGVYVALHDAFTAMSEHSRVRFTYSIARIAFRDEQFATPQKPAHAAYSARHVVNIYVFVPTDAY